MCRLDLVVRVGEHGVVQFFPTAEESINYYNQKRCVDGKGLVLPSQIVSLLNGPCMGPEVEARCGREKYVCGCVVLDSDGGAYEHG